MEIQKGMPGLKQAGIIANERLQQHLLQYGYAPVPRTPALWRHSTRDITFSLVDKKDADHLIASLKDSYEISVDWEGTLYCGITLDWNYDERWVDVSMPAYIPAMFHKFRHTKPRRRQDAPHEWDKPLYDASV